MEIKNVAKGEFIGYGTTYLAQDDMKIAIVPVGYAMGFARALSNQGRVLIDNERVGVVGLVNMNLLLVNATLLPNIKIYDSVTLIGNQKDQEITVASFAELSDQLNYELLTRLPQDIPRKIID
jgi:alanine racemase